MILLIYYAYLNTIKYYTVQVTNLYTDASDSQDNHTEVDNIIQMQMTPKIITIRYNIYISFRNMKPYNVIGK